MDLVKHLETKNPSLYGDLQDIKKFSLARWQTPYLSWFTNHNVEHSEEIIHLLGQILKPIENQESFLSEHELFVLLASAYLHDIGMQSLKLDGTPIDELTDKQYIEIRKRHAQESFNVILKRVMTVERDDFHLPESLDDDYVSPIAFVSKGHSTDFFDEVIKEFKENPPTPKNRPIRAEMLTSLLLIADELDLHNKRADFSKLAQIDISPYTQLHWFKHHYVNYVGVENGTIKITLVFPPKSAEYKELIHEYILTKLVEQIEKVNPSLKRETANLLQLESKIDIQIKEDSTGCVKRPLPPEVLDELKKVLGKKDQALPEETRPERTVSIYPKPSSIFTGMTEEMKKFQELLGKANFISIEGLGGFGKTQFAAKCIEEFIAKDKVVWFDCNPDAKLDTLIGISGYEYVLKGDNKTELAKYSGFTDLIERDEKVLFLDNFHDISDQSFKEFFKFSKDRLRKATIVLISREHPNVDVLVAPVDIKGLKDDAVDFAKKLRDTYFGGATISDNELQDICDRVDGHPLAIELALQLIRYGESPKDIVGKIVRAEEKSAELSHRLLDEIFKHSKSTEQEKKVMLLFSVFRGEVDKKAINFILEGEDAYATLYKLIDKKMISRSGDRLATHPLVREFCYKRLENKKEAHLKAAQYLKTFRTDKFDPVLEEEIAHHLLTSESFEALADLISEKGEEFILTGNTNSLKEMIDKVIAKGIERAVFYVYYGDISTIRSKLNEASELYEKAFAFTGVDEKVMAEAYIKYGEMLFRRGSVKESHKYFEDAYAMCKKSGDRKGEAHSLNDIGIVDDFFGNAQSAEANYMEAAKLRIAINDKKGLVNTYHNIGQFFASRGYFDKALDNYKKSLELSNEISNREGIALIFRRIGELHSTKGELDKALIKFKESLKIYEEIGAKQETARVLGGIGGVLTEEGKSLRDKAKLDEAFDIYKKVWETSIEIGDRDGIASALTDIGNVFYWEKDYKEALTRFEESLKINEEIGNIRGGASNLNNIGNIFLDKGQFKDALKYYQKSLELEEKMGQRMALATTYYNLGIVFLNLRNHSVSIEHFLKSIALRSQMDLPPNKSVDQIINLRSQIGSQKFKGLATNAYNGLPEDLKPFANLEKFTADTTVHRETPKVGRNDPCPCGSGKKYKKCHGK